MEDQRDPLGVIGQRAVGFTILALLAEGGMGAIYLAQRPESPGAFYAVKCIPCAGSPGEIDTLKKIVEQEALLLKRLSGASVPRYEGHAFLAVPGKVGVVGCIFMEYLHGESLRDRIARRGEQGHSLREAIPLLSGAVTALAHAHRNVVDNNRQEIVAHLDLKPENIFLQRFGNVERSVLLDLGVARRLLLAPRKTASVIDREAFTLMYGAPEQFDPETFGSPGPHTDVFALALILVELLTGKVALLNIPYEAIPAGYPVFQRAYMSAVNPGRRPNLANRREPGQRGAWDTDRIEPILERALSVDPHHRHIDVIDFWQDLCKHAGETIETEIGSLSSIPPPAASLRPSLLPQPSLSAGRIDPSPRRLSRPDFPGDTEPSPIPENQGFLASEQSPPPLLPGIPRQSLVPPPPELPRSSPISGRNSLFSIALLLGVVFPLGVGWKLTGSAEKKDASAPTATQSLGLAPPTPPEPPIHSSSPAHSTNIPVVSIASAFGAKPPEPERQRSRKRSGEPRKSHGAAPDTGKNEKNQPVCKGGEEVCGGRCVDLQTSEEHCGACGNPCSLGCLAGECKRIGGKQRNQTTPAPSGAPPPTESQAPPPPEPPSPNTTTLPLPLPFPPVIFTNQPQEPDPSSPARPPEDD